MESALRQLMAKQTDKPVAPADRPAIYEQGGESWSVERRGSRVLSLFGVPSAKRAAAADEVWRSWKIGKPAAPSTLPPPHAR